MIGAIVHQLTRNLNDEQVREGGFAPYFVDHTTGVYPTAASGFPWNAASMAVKGDVICDLSEDMAAEQKARVTYDNILRMSDDPDVNNVIRFLREREIVHFQRFGEAKRTRGIELLTQGRRRSHDLYGAQEICYRNAPYCAMMIGKRQRRQRYGADFSSGG